MDGEAQLHARQHALALIETVLELCDLMGESTPACHFQLGADLLRHGRDFRPRPDFELPDESSAL